MSENKTKFSFKIEGQSFELSEETVTVKSIIELAKEKGLPVAKHPIGGLILKSAKCVYSVSDRVNLSEENDFFLRKKTYKFKINGQELESNLNKLVTKEIIKMAKEKGVPLPGDEQKKLILESVGLEQSRKFELDEEVDIEQFCEFLIILNEPTPVA